MIWEKYMDKITMSSFPLSCGFFFLFYKKIFSYFNIYQLAIAKVRFINGHINNLKYSPFTKSEKKRGSFICSIFSYDQNCSEPCEIHIGWLGWVDIIPCLVCCESFEGG